MARIPDEVIERIKREVSVQRLIEARGIELKRQGKDWFGHCPFHEDHTPSLSVDPEQNIWNCLGACKIGGSVIDWVMKAEGVSFRHAAELLQNDYQPLAASSAAPIKRSTVRKLAAPIEHDAEDARLLVQVIDYYHQALLQSPDALAYLQKRGIASDEAVRVFKLGFANRTLGYRLPAANRVEGAAIRGRLQRLGLYRDSGHEHFNGSLIIPVINEAGEVTEIYGRKITPNLTKGTPLHLYLPGPHKGMWNATALQATKEVILCEALIDALTFWCAGYRNVTASYGVGGFTADHLAAFRMHGIERVLIAYDRDEAGDRAAEKLSKELMSAGLDCYRILFPKGMDANEYALKVGPAAKSLGVVIRSAQWLGKGQAKEITKTITTVACESSWVVEPVRDEAAPIASSLVAEETAKEEDTASNPVSYAAPVLDAVPEVKDGEVLMSFGDRRYRIRGLTKNLSYEILKINLLAARDTGYYVDTFDLYSARQRYQYLVHAAKELGVTEEVIKVDLGKLLSKLEALQQARIEEALKVEPALPAMSEAERTSALELLRDPKLFERILVDFEACGMVGERTNKLVGYLAAVSRKLDRPLAIVVQSSSAAGKSSLMDAVLAFIPEEERIKYSAMTGQSLFYLGETNLKHKILAIVEEEGASRASYALKLLQSEGELTIASTGKDPQTGNLVTQEYRVEGPVMIMLTTTAIEIDEELLNRCLVLSVDEGREQTEAIHRLQRRKRTLAGLTEKHAKQRLLTQHQHAQRLLKPLAIVNPYADDLTFLSDKTRTRRDHEKYLTLIDTVALLHQYQRPIKTTSGSGGEMLEYIEVTLDDIAYANVLAHEVLGRSLDELPPQTRRVLARIVTLVNEHCTAQQMRRGDYRFSRRVVRDFTGLSDTQLRVHLDRLVELEYLLVHRGERGQSFVYELLFDGPADSAAPHLSGLIDIATMQSSRGLDPQIAGSMRGDRGPNAGGARSAEVHKNTDKTSVASDLPRTAPKTHVLRDASTRSVNGHDASYSHDAVRTSIPLVAEPLT